MSKQTSDGFIALLVLVALFVAIGFSIKFRYGECKKVGHSTLYCILDLGR